MKNDSTAQPARHFFAPEICPTCGEKSGLPLVFGYPGPSLLFLWQKKEIALGGCSLPMTPLGEARTPPPNRKCDNCGLEWRSPNGIQIDFSDESCPQHILYRRRERLRTLVELREKRKFLTVAEINNCFPEFINDPDAIESIIATFGPSVHQDVPDAEPDAPVKNNP